MKTPLSGAFGASLSNALNEAKKAIVTKRAYDKRHADDEGVDEVRIKTVPRWKESELSGNEWRISATLQFLRKGHVVFERSFHTVESAINAAPWFKQIAHEGEDFKRVPVEVERCLCMQPGCNEKATKEFKIKQEYVHREGVKTESSGEQRRRFCDKHKMRGDCGLEDADTNYEVV